MKKKNILKQQGFMVLYYHADVKEDKRSKSGVSMDVYAYIVGFSESEKLAAKIAEEFAENSVEELKEKHPDCTVMKYPKYKKSICGWRKPGRDRHFTLSDFDDAFCKVQKPNSNKYELFSVSVCDCDHFYEES